jgi:hypothetical protein
MENGKTWTTRQAARYLDLSTVAMLAKVELLGAVKHSAGYAWPVEAVKQYALDVAGKSLNDPTRNRPNDR